MNAFIAKLVGVLIMVGVTFSMLGAYKSTSAVQVGYPGLAMEQIDKNSRLEQKLKDNKVPPALPAASQDGQLAVDAYKNVQVLGHITSGEMTRLMTAMTIWVAPQQGCAYCHAPQRDPAGKVVTDNEGNPQADQNNLGSDELYTKRVARRMLQMTMHINSDWKEYHVKDTGVTCYTCHRGNPVPVNIWYNQAPDPMETHFAGNHAEQNSPATVAGLTSLPYTALQTFLDTDEGIRIQSTLPLPVDNRSSIKQAEYTYSLMMNISTSLGVNCTYCHNSRSFGVWDASPPSRNVAWYGIRMVRNLNKDYLDPLTSTFPEQRLGPTGDGPKVNCATCHNGAYKPLLGVSMLKDYMVLAEAKPQPQKTVVPPPVPAEGAPEPGATPQPGAATPVPGAPPTPGAAAPAQGAVAPAPVVPTPGGVPPEKGAATPTPGAVQAPASAAPTPVPSAAPAAAPAVPPQGAAPAGAPAPAAHP